MAEKFTIEWVRNAWSPSAGPMVRTYPEGASATFKKGSPVIYDDSEDGVVEVPRTSGTIDSGAFLGIALQDATGTTGSDIDVLIPMPGDIFSAPLATDADTLLLPAVDDVYGEIHSLVKLSSTAGGNATEWAVLNGGSEDLVKVIDFDPRDVARRAGIGNLVAGDRVLFRFIAAALDLAGRQG